jgi:hypothetical protein
VPVRTIRARFGRRIVVGQHAQDDGSARAASSARAAPLGYLVDRRRAVANHATNGGVGDRSADAYEHGLRRSFPSPFLLNLKMICKSKRAEASSKLWKSLARYKPMPMTVRTQTRPTLSPPTCTVRLASLVRQ